MKNKYIDMVRYEGMEHYGFGPCEMEKIKVCEFCGCVSLSTERYCRECARPLPEKNLYQSYKERHKFCEHCGTILTDSCEFCPQCGVKVQKIKCK